MTDIKITDKEKKFIELKAAGLKMRDIAKELFMSEGYLENFARELYQKTGTKNGSSLINWAWLNSILKISKENLPNSYQKTR